MYPLSPRLNRAVDGGTFLSRILMQRAKWEKICHQPWKVSFSILLDKSDHENINFLKILFLLRVVLDSKQN